MPEHLFFLIIFVLTLRQFHAMHFDDICVFSKSFEIYHNILWCTHIMFSFICLNMYSLIRASQSFLDEESFRCTVHLQEVILFENKPDYPPSSQKPPIALQLGVRFSPTSSTLCLGIIWLETFRSCACCHNSCEFICIVALSCLGHAVLCSHLSSLILPIFASSLL